MSSAARKSEITLEQVAGMISTIIAKQSGNVLEENQQSMVISRLKKRMLDLGGLTPSAYYGHFETNRKEETAHLISLLTTHHTFFFREFGHFQYILEQLPEIVARAKKGGRNKIRLFCAACSRGQEAYSLAMFMNVHLKQVDPSMSYEILATDIDSESVKYGQNGVYTYGELKSVPQMYISGNWQRGVKELRNFVRAKKEIKGQIKFDTLNLLELDTLPISQRFDIIMCRNVFIYFKDHDIKKICQGFKGHLYENGYLITGLSENLKKLELGVYTQCPSVYSFDKPIANEVAVKQVSKSSPVLAGPKAPVIPKPIRMLCVDDSKSVLKLMTKIFSSDPDFELVGTAMDGVEAEKFVKSNKVDAMTLDIHMPEKDGVEYLHDNFNKNHPKVVVVSSASREDLRYAQKTLDYGASDFVEKPALNNLAKRADEIKMKIKMSFLSAVGHLPTVDAEFKKDFRVKNAEDKSRYFMGHYSDLKRIIHFINHLKIDQPPMFLFLEGNKNVLEFTQTEIGNQTSFPCAVYEEGKTNIEKNHIYICDFDTQFKEVSEKMKDKKSSVCVFGGCSQVAADGLLELKESQILLEDIEGINEDLKQVASDIFPWTSFAHVSTEFLSEDDE